MSSDKKDSAKKVVVLKNQEAAELLKKIYSAPNDAETRNALCDALIASFQRIDSLEAKIVQLEAKIDAQSSKTMPEAKDRDTETSAKGKALFGARNPFGLKDVNDPEGEDCIQFAAANLKLLGNADDPNAKIWSNKVKSPEQSPAGSNELDGTWAGRWGGGSAGDDFIAGIDTVRIANNRIYIKHVDKTNTYLIEAVRDAQDPNIFCGRYHNCGATSDSTPWCGKVINKYRIDGIWTMGRWDLQRPWPATAGKKD
jgi:hypothetical protein